MSVAAFFSPLGQSLSPLYHSPFYSLSSGSTPFFCIAPFLSHSLSNSHTFVTLPVSLIFFRLSPHLTPILTMSHSSFYSLYSVSIHFFCLTLVILYHSPFHSHSSVSLPFFCLTSFLLSHSPSNSRTIGTLSVLLLFLCFSPHLTPIFMSPFYPLSSVPISFVLLRFLCLSPHLTPVLIYSIRCLTPVLLPYFCLNPFFLSRSFFISFFRLTPILLSHSPSHSFSSVSVPI
jgi:hypothetical protein